MFNIKKKEKSKIDMKKQVGIIVMSIIVGYLVAVGLKYMRGMEQSVFDLFIITSTVSYFVIYFLVKRKESKK